MKKLLVILLIAVLSACSTVLDSTKSLSNIAVADAKIRSGEVTQTIKYAQLSQTEALVVDHAVNKYIFFSETWKQKIKGLDATSSDFVEFATQYEDMVKQYNTVKALVEIHWAEYPKSHQVFLKEYEDRAEKFDTDIRNLMNAQSRNKAMSEAILFATALAGKLL